VSELAAYLRLLPAPHRGAVSTLSKEEARGRDLFVSAEVGCGSCHALDQEASDRRLHDVASRAKSDEGRRFRTPPLLFLAGTAPYFHDGRYPTLEELLEDNLDRMGSTTHLSDADITALAAFLRTL
jgi:cytochrome c peroxidase